jgi:glucose-6-phosphate 1-epimerase
MDTLRTIERAPMATMESSVVSGAGGLPKVVLVAADGARAEVLLHGAHVTSWVPAGDTERLFLSSRSDFQSGRAVRGGVPVIFPQFANEGPLPKHGFARNTAWRLVTLSPDGHARFRLASSSATEAMWPHTFVAELLIAVKGKSLDVTLRISNTGATPVTFTAALHTYLRVSDVREAHIRGLGGLSYRDATQRGEQRQEMVDEVAIVGEVNRIYFDARSPVTVEERDRTTVIEMQGFNDVVVWNPGSVGSAALADMEPDGYLRMLCVEPAVIGTPVTLPPAGRWTGRQRLLAG